MNRRVQNDEGEWVNDEPMPRNVKVYVATTHVHDSCGSGDPIFVTASSAPRAGRPRRPARSAPRTSWSSTTASARSASRSSTCPRASTRPAPGPGQLRGRLRWISSYSPRTSCSPQCRTSSASSPRSRSSWCPFQPGLPITRVDLPTDRRRPRGGLGCPQRPVRPHAQPGARLGHHLHHRGPPQRRAGQPAPLRPARGPSASPPPSGCGPTASAGASSTPARPGCRPTSTAERIAATTVLTGAVQPAASRGLPGRVHGRRP